MPTVLEKSCSKCGRVLPATREFFWLDKRGLRSSCKSCNVEYQREYARKNSEHKIAAARVWRDANPERVKELNLAWRRDNPEREREMKRAYRAANPEKIRMLARQTANTHNARKLGCIVSKADYASILEEYGMTCHICGGGIATMSDLHFDHVVPLARGGQHSKANIRPSHRVCNQRKGARIWETT